MPNFINYDYNQNAMVVINYLDQLQPGTFEFAVQHLITNKIDTSVFHPRYKNEKNGRPAYDPAILLKVILFAYSKGITSSREIQWCCQFNILFKALSCDTVPHFTTIANFVSSYSEEIENVFDQVLLVCHEEGLLGNELFAIDGCKMPSDASKEWSGTLKELKEKRDKIKKLIRHNLNEQKRQDEEMQSDEQRSDRIEQAIKTLNCSLKKINNFLDDAEPRMGQGKKPKEVKSNITDNESAKMKTSKGTIQGFNGVATVDKKHQIVVDAQAFGEGQEHHTLAPVLKKIEERFKRLKISENIYATGTIVTADTGFANEANMKYLFENNINGYIPDNKFRSRDPKFAGQKKKYGKRNQDNKKRSSKKVIPANEFTVDAGNNRCICPAGNVISFREERDDGYGNIKQYYTGRLMQCRNCHLKNECMKNPDSANHRHGNGRQVSFIVGRVEKINYTDWMKTKVDSPKGKQIYSHRMSVVEPVFGNLGSNKKLDRFSLRGKTKVDTQWKLYCLVQNIEKLSNYGQLAA